MLEENYDVLIIGGGPAGTAAALTLLKYTETNVAVVEKSDYTKPRIGETVAPSLLPLLEYLGCKSEFVHLKPLPSFSIDAAWGADHLQTRDFLFTAQGNGWHLDRTRFDQMLAKKVNKMSGEVFKNTEFIAQKQLKNGWQITVSNNGKKRKINAKFVIDASGRSAVFARSLGSKWKILDAIIGIACYYQRSTQRQVQRMLIETTPHGWWYTAPLPKNNRVAVFMTDGDIGNKLDAIKNWQFLLEKTNHIKKEAVGKIIFGPKAFPAYSHIIGKIKQKNWLPAGDAASAFDPVSSMGIGYSMLSGIYAAKSIYESKNTPSSIQNYIKNISRNFEEYLIRRKYYYSNEKRWFNNTFWIRRNLHASKLMK